jgi:hypothetical protein
MPIKIEPPYITAIKRTIQNHAEKKRLKGQEVENTLWVLHEGLPKGGEISKWFATYLIHRNRAPTGRILHYQDKIVLFCNDPDKTLRSGWVAFWKGEKLTEWKEIPWKGMEEVWFCKDYTTDTGKAKKAVQLTN